MHSLALEVHLVQYQINFRNSEKTEGTLETMGKYVDQISGLEQKIPTQVDYY